jgi:hypothetical protein
MLAADPFRDEPHVPSLFRSVDLAAPATIVLTFAAVLTLEHAAAGRHFDALVLSNGRHEGSEAH